MLKENPCEFTDEYKTDIALIDGEHKTLFEITGRVYDILKAGATEEDSEKIIEILKELRQYTVEHFSDEEEYMRSVNYDGLDAQIRAHRTFIAELDDVDEDEIRNKPQEYVKSLIEFLLGLLDMKSARKLAGTTNRRLVLEDIEAFSSREVFTKLIVFI